MDGAGNDKECADNNDEARIFARGMLNAGEAVQGEDVIAGGGRRQERTQFLVMPFPMLLQNEKLSRAWTTALGLLNENESVFQRETRFEARRLQRLNA